MSGKSIREGAARDSIIKIKMLELRKNKQNSREQKKEDGAQGKGCRPSVLLKKTQQLELLGAWHCGVAIPVESSPEPGLFLEWG